MEIHFLIASLGFVLPVALCGFGSAYGTVKAANSLFSVGVMKPNIIVKGMISIIMAGIIGIYGFLVSIFVIKSLSEEMSHLKAAMLFGSGFTTGLGGIVSGYGIGCCANSGIRGISQQEKLLFSYILTLVLNEVLVIYTLIVSCIITSQDIVLKNK